jgi:hypothetical protein
MIFMLLFYANEKTIAAMSADERNGLVERHIHYFHEVLEKRTLVLATRGLDPTSTAMTVRVVDGAPTVTAGPFGPNDEALSGFYLIDCEGLDEALELARLYPMPEGLGCIEVRPVMRTWDFEPSIDTPAAPASVWRLYSDVTTWPKWKAGIERLELGGLPFVTGTVGLLTPSGQFPMEFRIVEAIENEGYISETVLGDGIVLRMEHTLAPLPGGGTRITHRATVPRTALELFGMKFSPDLNSGMVATLEALSEEAQLLETTGREPARA